VLDPELTSRYWVVRKVVSLVGYFGGLRNIELRSIEFNKTFGGGEKSFEMDESGYWFTFERGKQRGLPVVSSFCVPRRQPDWAPPVSSSDRNPVDYDPASVIDHYLGIVELDLNQTRDQLSGGFFKSAHGKNARLYRNVPMGKNLLEKVGREFAEELFLPHPASFTSHCWRRSCGTNASDSGVNVTTLMAHLGWTTPKTAIGYVQKSRRTSLNVSMFLSNVQRENQDLDKILSMLKSLVPGTTGKPPDKVDVLPKKEKVVAKKAIITSAVDNQLSLQFASHMAAARNRESGVVEEAAGVDQELSDIVDDHHELVGGIDDLVAVNSAAPVSHVSVGMGGGNVSELLTGSGGGSVLALDPRISAILNNLQNHNHGQFHVHFHFGNN
jgi:hypothetical protein